MRPGHVILAMACISSQRKLKIIHLNSHNNILLLQMHVLIRIGFSSSPRVRAP